MEKDIKDELFHILTTIQLLEKSFTSGYLVRILQGDKNYPFKRESHKEIRTFGILSYTSFRYIKNVIKFGVNEDYIKVVDLRNGFLGISPKGEQLLDAPVPVMIREKLLRTPWYDYYLEVKLREVRNKYANKVKIPLYRIYNNYMLEQIVELKPVSEADIRYIVGMPELSKDILEEVIETVKNVLAKKSRKDRAWIYERAYRPSHFKIKELFEKGYSLETIAEHRDIRPATVQRYLLDLHLAGEIDLREWIEEQVDDAELHRGVEYFKQVDAPRLKEAHDVLGLDYDVLRLCRAYALKVDEAPLRYAS